MSATTPLQRTPAAWLASDLQQDQSWIYRLDDAAHADLLDGLRQGAKPGKKLLDYRRSDFRFGPALETLRRAFCEAGHGRGVALIKNMPRKGLTPDEFELMTWAIGLHFGVPRPQDKNSLYMNQVRNVGTVYRSPTGRGYSSNAELDFHVDGTDIVALTCYNDAKAGGMSMCSSSEAAFYIIQGERPDLAETLQQPVPFGLQGGQAEGQAPFWTQPIYGVSDDRLICTWARNRVENGAKLPGAPALSDEQREAFDFLDEVVRRKELMYSMWLEPGDMQLLNNHTVLHSRTEFEDYEDESRRRTLYRLWLATPDSIRLPAAWKDGYGTTEPGAVRGGMKGQKYDEACRLFDQEQAAQMGMSGA